MLHPRIAALASLALLTVAADASAKDDVDVRWPLRFGMGYSAPYAVGAPHVGFDAEIQPPHLSESVAAFVFTSIDALYIPDAGTVQRAYAAFSIGAGLFIHAPGIGPAVSLHLGLGLLSGDDDVVGGGVSLVANVYPYYFSLTDAIACRRGPFASYLASSVFLWTGGRLDVANESRGGIVSFGVGLDLSRSVLLPVIAYVLKKGCSKAGGPTPSDDEDEARANLDP